MMPKTYAQLKSASERCIYDAFACAPGIDRTPEQMGAFVNAKGYDADDDAALTLLAAEYGFKRVEAIKGDVFDKLSPLNGSYRCDENADIIAAITNHRVAINLFDEWKFGDDPTGSLLRHKPADVMAHPSLVSAEWHAIYGKTDGHGNVTWTDKQQRYKNGPSRGSIALLFIKK
jgi:hypothetical protein